MARNLDHVFSYAFRRAHHRQHDFIHLLAAALDRAVMQGRVSAFEGVTEPRKLLSATSSACRPDNRSTASPPPPAASQSRQSCRPTSIRNVGDEIAGQSTDYFVNIRVFRLQPGKL